MLASPRVEHANSIGGDRAVSGFRLKLALSAAGTDGPIGKAAPPATLSAMNNHDLLNRLGSCEQSHALRFWDRLSESQRASLAAQLSRIDLEEIARLYARRGDVADFGRLLERMEPLPAIRLADRASRLAEASRAGLAALAAGRAAAMVVAGGQGTRLGFEHPKGLFPIGPLSRRTLFQIHVEKAIATARRCGARLPLFVMTSPATDAETRDFFARNNRFGLPADDLFVFCQGTMPVVSAADGRLLLDAPDHVAESPDGHGGMPAALARSGGLDELTRRGVEYILYFQVDNPLATALEPWFLGLHLLRGAEMSSQVVAKRSPEDRVGNVVSIDGRLHVIEYSDLPDEFARRRAADGSLMIWAGSIAVHVINVDLLRRSVIDSQALPFHLAHKRVPYLDDDGRRIEPPAPNAIKFERFIFDLMPQARNGLVVEVDPTEAFAPLKNAPGSATDSPQWVRERIVALHRRWLSAAGVELGASVDVEISPLWALDAEEAIGKLPRGTKVERSTYFSAEGPVEVDPASPA